MASLSLLCATSTTRENVKECTVTANPAPDPLTSMWACLAHELRFYRTRAGLTGDEFGKIMGVVRSTVSRMESGE